MTQNYIIIFLYYTNNILSKKIMIQNEWFSYYLDIE